MRIGRILQGVRLGKGVKKGCNKMFCLGKVLNKGCHKVLV